MGNVLALIVSALLAALLGFAAHRASVCTVRAVAEILSTRRAYMLIAFAKTALWAMAVTLPLAWWLGDAAVATAVWPVTINALFGGFIFGTGAALNQACAFSTLTKLSDGDLSMLLTVCGFALGVAAFHIMLNAAIIGVPVSLGDDSPGPGLAGATMVVVLWGFVLIETTRLFRSRSPNSTWRERARANAYRLSTAAILLGLSNGVIYVLVGPWSWTAVVAGSVGTGFGNTAPPALVLWLMLAAVLAGMRLSSWQRRSFQLRARPDLGWSMNLIAGVMMGLGAALAPGGNDVFILHAIPSLSPHALPAFAAMLAGIALPMYLMRLKTGQIMRVDCTGDLCRVPTVPREEQDLRP